MCPRKYMQDMLADSLKRQGYHFTADGQPIQMYCTCFVHVCFTCWKCKPHLFVHHLMTWLVLLRSAPSGTQSTRHKGVLQNMVEDLYNTLSHNTPQPLVHADPRQPDKQSWQSQIEHERAIMRGIGYASVPDPPPHQAVESVGSTGVSASGSAPVYFPPVGSPPRFLTCHPSLGPFFLQCLVCLFAKARLLFSASCCRDADWEAGRELDKFKVRSSVSPNQKAQQDDKCGQMALMPCAPCFANFLSVSSGSSTRYGLWQLYSNTETNAAVYQGVGALADAYTSATQ